MRLPLLFWQKHTMVFRIWRATRSSRLQTNAGDTLSPCRQAKLHPLSTRFWRIWPPVLINFSHNRYNFTI